LAGFTDSLKSPSGFNLDLSNRKSTIRFQSNFKLTINTVLPNDVKGELAGSAYFLLFSKICEYFKTSLVSKTIRLNNIKFIFVIIAYSPASQDIVEEYFKKFPLLGKISIDYKDWCEARFKALNKSYLQPEAVRDIKTIKQRMNMTRSSWRSNQNTLGSNHSFYLK
jgi:hypothetical protein